MTFGIGFDVSKAGDDGETLAQILYVSLHFLLVACGIQVFLIIYGFSIFKDMAPPKPTISGNSPPHTASSFDAELSASAKATLQKQVRTSRSIYMGLGLAIFAVFLAYLILTSVYLAGMMLREEADILPYDEYFRQARGGWVSVMGLASLMLLGYLSSGLLTYRSFMLWEGQVRVVGVPIIANTASLALGTVTLVEMRRTNDTSANNAIPFACAWITLNAVANLVASGLIAFRLLRPPFHRPSTETETSEHQDAATNNQTPSPKPSIGIKSILTESGLPFYCFGIAAAVFYTPSLAVTPASVPIISLWACFTAIAPQLIIFRVATGVSPTSGAKASIDVPQQGEKIQLAPMKFARRRRFTLDDSFSMPTVSSNAGHVPHIVT